MKKKRETDCQGGLSVKGKDNNWNQPNGDKGILSRMMCLFVQPGFLPPDGTQRLTWWVQFVPRELNTIPFENRSEPAAADMMSAGEIKRCWDLTTREWKEASH